MFYCNKIINIHGIIQRLKPIGFICLIQSWPQLHCNDHIVVTTGLVWVQALRRNGRGSSTTAASSCTEGYHAENLQRNQQRHFFENSFWIYQECCHLDIHTWKYQWCSHWYHKHSEFYLQNIRAPCGLEMESKLWFEQVSFVLEIFFQERKGNLFPHTWLQ